MVDLQEIFHLHRYRLGDNITSFRVRKTRYDVITPTNGF